MLHSDTEEMICYKDNMRDQDTMMQVPNTKLETLVSARNRTPATQVS